jgi:hypothetical protein
MVPWVINFLQQFVFGGGKYKTPTKTGCQNLLETSLSQDWPIVSRYVMTFTLCSSELSDSHQASVDLRAAFECLSQVERDAILDPKGFAKLPPKDINKSEPGAVSASNNENSSEDHTPKDATPDVADDELVSPLSISALWNSGPIFVWYCYSFLRTLSRKDA